MMRLCWPILEVLSYRGVEDPEHVLRPPTWQDMPSPFTVPGVSDAVARIRLAIEEQERVMIFGDYDCDGTLASVILRSTISRLGLPQLSICLTETRDTVSPPKLSIAFLAPACT